MRVGHEFFVALQFSVQHRGAGHPGKQKATQRSVEHNAGVTQGAEPQRAGGVARLQNGRRRLPIGGRDLIGGRRRRLRGIQLTKCGMTCQCNAGSEKLTAIHLVLHCRSPQLNSRVLLPAFNCPVLLQPRSDEVRG